MVYIAMSIIITSIVTGVAVAIWMYLNNRPLQPQEIEVKEKQR